MKLERHIRWGPTGICPHLVLFNIVINYLDNGIGNTHIKSADDTKLEGDKRAVEESIRIQNGHDKLEKWSEIIR